MKSIKQIKLDKRYLPIISIFCVGIFLSIFIFRTLLIWGTEKIRSEFELTVADRHYSIEREKANNFELFRSVQAFYESSVEVTRKEFKTFVNSIIRSHSNDIQSIEWIPMVLDLERQTYEETTRMEGFPDFQITELNPQGNKTRANKRDEYFPIYFIEPYEKNKMAMGFDIASDPICLKALKKARDTGKMTITEQITLIQGPDKQHGFLAFLPVYYRNKAIDTVKEKRANLFGVVGASFRSKQVIEEPLTYITHAGIDIHVYDESTTPRDKFVYLHTCLPEEKYKNGIIKKLLVKNNKFEVSHKLNVADRTWMLTYEASHDFIAQRKTWQPLGSLSVGLLFTFLLSFYMLITVRRTVKIEQLAEKLLTEINEHKLTGKKLEKTLREKEILLEEIHHRVKNNLVLLYGLISLQQSTIGDKEIEKDLLETAKQRIGTVSKIHQMMYQAKSLAAINFSKYIRDIVDETKKIYKLEKKKITIEFDVEPITFTIEKAIPCALIINELVTNIFKHAFINRDSGRVRVLLKREGDHKKLQISDDGIGMPEEFMSKSHEKLGLRLITMLTQQLKGDIKYKRENGSIFTIVF